MCIGVLAWSGCGSAQRVTPTLSPLSVAAASPSPEPLVPTPIVRRSSAEAEPSFPLAATAFVETPLPSVVPQGRERFGVGVPDAAGPITDYPVERLGIGWYLNWGVEVMPARPEGIAFWQMVRVSKEGYRPDEAEIRAAVAVNPGSVWLIGNEPDVVWQDNTTPERYAELYHELYHFLKSADATCQVAIGGVSQPTPLRLAYLERVLVAYQSRYGEPMPVDVWNVHGFLLREERGSWGVSIPPGFEATAGVLYGIEDHDDLEAFQSQILSFRRWMAQHGQRDRPLVVSEYGILMPVDYGFDQARVKAFMYATFDFFSTATDEHVGYPQDSNRLVQWWAWYSLADTTYPTGNLFDPETKAVASLGSAFAQYALPDSGDGR